MLASGILLSFFEFVDVILFIIVIKSGFIFSDEFTDSLAKQIFWGFFYVNASPNCGVDVISHFLDPGNRVVASKYLYFNY